VANRTVLLDWGGSALGVLGCSERYGSPKNWRQPILWLALSIYTPSGSEPGSGSQAFLVRTGTNKAFEIRRQSMANILLSVEHGVEVAAEDVLKFVSGAVVASNKAEPGVIAGLGVLLGTVAKTLGDLNGVATNPLNFPLDAATIQDLKAVWPAIVQFAGSIGIKL
jgi:hypothetical protein